MTYRIETVSSQQWSATARHFALVTSPNGQVSAYGVNVPVAIHNAVKRAKHQGII